MNRWVRLFFLPIMLLAGVFTSFMCALIISPFALCHRLRQVRSNADDIARYRERCQRMQQQIYGPSAPAPASDNNASS